MTKSKVQTVAPQADKQWNDKVLKKDFVLFENGESGVVTTFPDGVQPKPGDELEYTIEDKGYGAEVKLAKSGKGGGGGFAKKTPEQEANLNAIAITKSALEGNHIPPIEWKSFYIEAYTFFINFAKESTKGKLTEGELGMPFDT